MLLIDRREILAMASGLVLRAVLPPGRAAAGEIEVQNPLKPLVTAPSDPAERARLREALTQWRRDLRTKLHYDGATYGRSEFAWVPTTYACCFLMIWDETIYDPDRNLFTVDEFLDHGRAEFGGYDAVVLWHAYPRIGFDERNQFDYFRDMPGGIEGIAEVGRRFHGHGVKVFFEYRSAYKGGTRLEASSNLETLAEFVKAIDADGLFLDSTDRVEPAFRARLDAERRGVVLEPEDALRVEDVGESQMSWAQLLPDSYAPGVLRNKWFERRHMQHQIRRWDHDHTGELHTAWMNGSGMLIWENVFGTWVGWNARDRSILRSMLPIQRRYSSLFSGEQWTPWVETEAPDVFASLWELDGLRLWTLINRSGRTVDATLLKVPHREGARYFDLVRGSEIEPGHQGGGAALAGVIRPRGIGAILTSASTVLGDHFDEFLENQRRMESRADFDVASPIRKTALKPPPPSSSLAQTHIPETMVEVPPAIVNMVVVFRARECGFYDNQTSISLSGPTLHKPVTFAREVTLGRYAMDLTPVTNLQFQEFLRSSGYKPIYGENFLKHWTNGVPPKGMEDHPVVYVDLGDARAYAKWAGKRLPSEEEWQYAAQGQDGRRYPWGNELIPGFCNQGETGSTTPVTAFPDGRSPFGCWDMCGNVWEWTESERSDGRTHFAILRGGCWFQSNLVGSQGWYADSGPQPCNFALKFLLMWSGLNRCFNLGFRCAVAVGDEGAKA